MSAEAHKIGIGNSQESAATRGYSDIVLAFGVVAIIALMILPLPLVIIDMLVAVNILLGVGLVLMAIYIPSPVAFSSFPSVILLSTLFRLSLSIAITRLILLDADAGDIIEAFGRMVVGGNMVVGIVVFVIITVVQFIVIAKGSERVAEVAARFTLDAMPGKQMSIDSDLRSGLLDKDEARAKRRMLEVESQLHGSLDGAMKFVKGDAIAGIIIVIVNILGGLAIGVLQRGMSLSDAVQTYSILTVGDGLVAQIPALLTSISAGLIITRSASSNDELHLGSSIAKHFSSYPRVTLISGVLAFLLALVPGFPWLVFLVLGSALLFYSAWREPGSKLRERLGFSASSSAQQETTMNSPVNALEPPDSVVLAIGPGIAEQFDGAILNASATNAVLSVQDEFGVPVPLPSLRINSELPRFEYCLEVYGVSLASGYLKHDQVFLPLATCAEQTVSDGNTHDLSFSPAFGGQWITQSEAGYSDHWLTSERVLEQHLRLSLSQHLGLFLGIQEVSNLVTRWSQDYPDLVKEMLRVVTPQRLTEVLRRLVQEALPIRNLRDIFEAITDVGGREKDVTQLTEQVRVALSRHTSHRYVSAGKKLRALLLHPDLEDALRQTIRENGANPNQLIIDPDTLKKLTAELHDTKSQQHGTWRGMALLCSLDIRRYVRRITEMEFFELPVLSYQELAGDIQVEPVGQLGA